MPLKPIIFGIVQGRLIQSPPGHLQWFPQDQWQREFALAENLGYRFIEFIAERGHSPRNPLWTDAGIARIKTLAKKHGLIRYALCNDYIIDHSLAKGSDAMEHSLRLIVQGRKLGIKKFVLPLFEQSELNERNLKTYKPVLRELADSARAHGMMLCLETILNGSRLLRLLDQMGHSNIKLVFDTGNRIAWGHDIYGDIVLLGKEIQHVHIKDKNKDNENVLLGTGLVNFRKVFESLSKIKYAGAFTFETIRGSDPVRTAAYNKQFIEFFIRDVQNAR